MIEAPEKVTTTPETTTAVPTIWISPAAQRILCRAKEIIEERGWGQRRLYEFVGVQDQNRAWWESFRFRKPITNVKQNYCILGAIFEASEEQFGYPANLYKADEVKLAVDTYLGRSCVRFNDDKGRTKADVLHLLEELTTCK